MSGVKVVQYLLGHSVELGQTIPADRQYSSYVPQGTDLPAIAVSSVSVVERLTVAMTENKKLCTERVQITVQAKTYAALAAALDLVRDACPNTRGTVDGVDVDSVLPDVVGPDLRDDEAQIFMRSRDFIVKYSV